jgi:hypothetical protein
MSRTVTRLGGRARTIDGATIFWSRADGARGTRWREALERDGRLTRSVLVEVSAGVISRLEVATKAGLLTLHPSADGSTLHGNVVTPSGIRHLSFPWGADRDIMLLGSPAIASTTLSRLASDVPVGQAIDMEMLVIDDALEPRPMTWRVEHEDEATWDVRQEDTGQVRRLTLDPNGYPVLADAHVWPLEP